ncbi:WcaI family glycosyltransferase [Sphingomonas zeae]
MAKIILCCMNYRPEIISTGKYAFELCEYMAGKGHAVEVITTVPHYPGWKSFAGYSPFKYMSEKMYGVRVWRAPMYLNQKASGIARLLMPLSWSLFSAPILLARAAWTRPDVIISVQPTIFAAPFVLLASRLCGARTVQHVQDLEIDTALAVGHVRAGGKLVRFAHAMERWIMQRFDSVVTISAQMRARLIAKGVSPENIAIVRNWVDTSVIRPLDRPSCYRTELGISPETFVVQYSGQMGRKQALHILIQAAERMAGDTRFMFVLAGNGPMRAEIEQANARLPNMRLLELQPTERLGEFLNLADCHILPQDVDVSELVLPSKLGGMLASGKRMLITAQEDSELANFLGSAATFTPPGEVDAIVRALSAMIDAPDTSNALRAERTRDLDATTLLPAFERTLLVHSE